MKSKLALFDLDGTLYDTRMVNFMSYQKALRECGSDIDYNYFASYCNGRHYSVFLPELLKDNEVVEKVHKLKKEYYHLFLKNAVENRNLFDLIDCMKETYYIVLVTTASRKNCMELLECFGRTSLFDRIITQEDVTKMKPDPEGFLLAMCEFSIMAENSVIYEDSAVGLQAAEASGATVFAVKGYA